MSKEEKQSFGKYSLDEFSEMKGFKTKDLTIKSSETLNLTADSKAFKDYFKLVKIKDIAVVKELIGISDKIASRRNCGCSKISKVPSLKDLDIKDKNLRNENFAAARNMANQYIYGNSTSVSAYKPLLDRYLEISKAKNLNLQLPLYMKILLHCLPLRR